MAYRTLTAAVAHLHERSLTASALLEECLSKIAAQEPTTHAFITLLEEEARQAAAASDARRESGAILSPLDGIPLTIKDIFDVQGVATTAGSSLLSDAIATQDAPLVAALRAQGAIILGKSNMHEFAFGVTSANATFGAVQNPDFPAYLPGGSSGGTAAAITAGFALGGVGSDTGGSIRIPAACCRLVGLKPTYGLLSTERAVPQAWSLDHAGPMGRSVEDVRLLLAGLTDKASLPSKEDALGCLSGVRIGVPQDLLAQAHPRVQADFQLALAQLEAQGVEVLDFYYPDLETAFRAWMTIMMCEAASYHDPHLRADPARIEAGIRPYLLAGKAISATGYLEAKRFRSRWEAELRRQAAGVDMIATPCFPFAVPRRDEAELPGANRMIPIREGMVLYQWMANLSGWPALSLPLPAPEHDPGTSLMLTGKPFGEARLLAFAGLCEDLFAA